MEHSTDRRSYAQCTMAQVHLCTYIHVEGSNLDQVCMFATGSGQYPLPMRVFACFPGECAVLNTQLFSHPPRLTLTTVFAHIYPTYSSSNVCYHPVVSAAPIYLSVMRPKRLVAAFFIHVFLHLVDGELEQYNVP
jgi:hypothetical protein